MEMKMTLGKVSRQQKQGDWRVDKFTSCQKRKTRNVEKQKGPQAIVNLRVKWNGDERESNRIEENKRRIYIKTTPKID